MLPDEADVNELTRSVFVTVIGLEPELQTNNAVGDAHATSSAVGSPTTTTFTVDVSGGWVGSIHILVGKALALEIARRMLDRLDPADVLEESDINDAMKEVANMIGGNIKSLVPGPSRLSLPRITETFMHGTENNLYRLCFSCEGSPFSVFVEAHSNHLSSHTKQSKAVPS